MLDPANRIASHTPINNNSLRSTRISKKVRLSPHPHPVTLSPAHSSIDPDHVGPKVESDDHRQFVEEITNLLEILYGRGSGAVISHNEGMMEEALVALAKVRVAPIPAARMCCQGLSTGAAMDDVVELVAKASARWTKGQKTAFKESIAEFYYGFNALFSL